MVVVELNRDGTLTPVSNKSCQIRDMKIPWSCQGLYQSPCSLVRLFRVEQINKMVNAWRANVQLFIIAAGDDVKILIVGLRLLLYSTFTVNICSKPSSENPNLNQSRNGALRRQRLRGISLQQPLKVRGCLQYLIAYQIIDLRFNSVPQFSSLLILSINSTVLGFSAYSSQFHNQYASARQAQ